MGDCALPLHDAALTGNWESGLWLVKQGGLDLRNTARTHRPNLLFASHAASRLAQLTLTVPG